MTTATVGAAEKYSDEKTLASPALAVMDNQLYAMIRASLGTGIYFNRGRGSRWERLSGETLSSPALAYHNRTLFALIHGTDNGIYVNEMVRGRWGRWTRLEGIASFGGSLASYNGQLYAAVPGADKSIYINSMDFKRKMGPMDQT